MELRWCRFDGVRQVTSSVTDRVLRMNDSEQFYVPPDGRFDCVPVVIDSFKDYCSTFVSQTIKPGRKFREFLQRLRQSTTAPAFAFNLDQLIEYVAELLTRDRFAPGYHSGKGQSARLLDLLVRLHAEDCLAFPLQVPFGASIKYPTAEWPWGGNWNFRNRLMSLGQVANKDKTNYHKRLWSIRLFLACYGAKETADLTPEVDGGLLFRNYGNNQNNRVPTVARFLLDTMLVEYPDSRIAFHPRDYGSNAPLSRTDGTMAWAVAEDATLEAWCGVLSKWLAEASTAYAANLWAANSILKYLIKNPPVTRKPIQFVRRDYSPPVAYVDWLGLALKPDSKQFRESVNRISAFVDWLLATSCSEKGMVFPEYGNPLSRLPYLRGQVETHRSAMPIQFMRMLKDIVRAPYKVGGVDDEALILLCHKTL